MKLSVIALCLGCLSLVGQGIDRQARAEASSETIRFLDEQSAEAKKQAADAQRRAIEGATLSAKTTRRDGALVHLKGAVTITQDGMTMTADEADYHFDTGKIEARGNVRITRIPK